MSGSITATAESSKKRFSLWQVILLTGLLVGTLDIATACIDFYNVTGKNPVRVLKYVASGVFGMKALSGGTDMALMGLLFHYIIAFSFTIFFFLIYPKVDLLSKSRILTAIVYGIFMWVITTRIVVPLSNTPPPPPFKIVKALKAAAILIVMIGIPLSFIAYNYFKKGRSTGNVPLDIVP